ncbi:MAG: hypothetical protein RJB66_923 [Pseudomonadota bacterium]
MVGAFYSSDNQGVSASPESRLKTAQIRDCHGEGGCWFVGGAIGS